MANFIRSAKSGSDPIRVRGIRYPSPASRCYPFFEVDQMPQPVVDQEFLTTEEAKEMANNHNTELTNLLDLTMKPAHSGESAVDDFAVDLFKALGYVKRDRVARTRKHISFLDLICGEWRHVRTDVCLVDRQQNNILLVVQEDKRFQPVRSSRASHCGGDRRIRVSARDGG